MRSTNGGVGAAMITEYQQALDDSMDIVIKLVDRSINLLFRNPGQDQCLQSG